MAGKHTAPKVTSPDGVELPVLWPNQNEVVDGVTPVDEVSQDPYLFTDTLDTLDETMGV